MRVLSLILGLWCCTNEAFSLNVIYAHLAFKGSNGSPYVESQVCVLNNSLHFVKAKGKSYQAAYRVRLFYINGMDTVASHDYTLRTPEITQPDDATFDLIDQRRTALPSGNYRIVLLVNDANGTDAFGEQRELNLYFPSEALAFSSPLLVKSYTRSKEKTPFVRGGYNIVPYPIAFFPETMKELTVYYEIYNSTKALNDTSLFLQYGLRTVDGVDVPGYQFTLRQHADSVNIFFSTLNIEKLEAGRYTFYLKALNKQTEAIGGTQLSFTRARKTIDGFNDYGLVDIRQTFASSLHSDSLMMWLGGLYHVTDDEGKNIIADIERKQDSSLARKFIYRAMALQQTDAPEDAWQSYRQIFEEVEYNFSSPVRHGYETDRGRVFLQYGEPNHRNVSTSEPGAYPYEVWQYYRIANGQTNVYFIFYLPGLATNDYKLIHATARGELQDSRWRYKIYPQTERNRSNADPDNTGVKDHFGQRVDDYIPR